MLSVNNKGFNIKIRITDNRIPIINVKTILLSTILRAFSLDAYLLIAYESDEFDATDNPAPKPTIITKIDWIIPTPIKLTSPHSETKILSINPFNERHIMKKMQV